MKVLNGNKDGNDCVDEKELLQDSFLPRPIRTTPIRTAWDRLPVRLVDTPGKFPRGGTWKTLGMAAVVGVLFLASWADVAGLSFPYEEEEYPQDETQEVPPENLKRKGVVDDSYLSLAGVEIGRTRLSEVIERMGAGEIYKQREGKHASSLICYMSERDDTVVLFESYFLEGGIVTAIWVGRMEFLRDKGKCAKLEWVDREKTRINGISLDLGFAEVEKILGHPTYRYAQFVSYDYEDEDVLHIESKVREVWIPSGIQFYFGESQINWFAVYKVLHWG